MYNNDELNDLMEMFNDDDCLEEGFFDKLVNIYKEKQKEADDRLAAKINKGKEKNLPKYDNGYGNPVSENDVEKYIKLFEKTINDITKLAKGHLTGCKMSNTEPYKREKQYADGICSIFISKQIVSLEENYATLKRNFPNILDGENFEDEDGSNLFNVVEPIFKKVEKRGFNYINSGHYSSNSFKHLEVVLDRSGEDITVDITIIYKKNMIQESYFEFDEDYLEEGFFDKLKEKRAEKKARKEEEKEMRRQKEEEEKAARKAKNDERKARQATEYLNKFVMYKASEEESGPKKDLADLANNIKAILKKEIPGCTFVGNKAKHKTTKLEKGCVLHEYSLIIFRMDEDNKKRFVKNTNDLSLKTKDTARRTADTAQKFGRVASMATGNYGYNTTDMIKGSVDMLTGDIDKLVEKDFIRRIQDPIIDMGFTGKRNAYIKEKNGMEYLGVKIEGKYSEYEIVVKVRYIIKPNDYVEESFEPVEELFGFGNKYKKYSDEELKKERDRYAGIIGNTNKPNEIRKNYKELNKINKELEGRNKVNKIVGDKKQTKGKEYDGNKVRTDIRKIWQDVQRLMKSNSDIKPFNDNGMFMHSMNDIYDLSDKDAGVYEAGVDEFLIVGIDLWDYKGGNPRQIIADSDDGWHPVNHAEEKLRKLISELLEKKYPDFKVLPYGGDWDTGDITIGLR